MMEKLMVDSVVTWARALQGGRLPLRPDGPPHEGATCSAVRARARRAHPREGRRGRQDDLPLRRGLELRRGGQQRPRRQRHPAQHGRHRHRHLQRPPARRARAAAARSAAVPEQGFVTGLLLRPERHRPGHAGRAARAAARYDRLDQGRPGRQPRRLRLRRPRPATRVTGAQVDYNGQPAGYTADPQEIINYVDGARQRDALRRHPAQGARRRTTMADRVRMQDARR